MDHPHPQTRSIPVQKTEEGELDREAEWVFQNVFSKLPISNQVSKPAPWSAHCNLEENYILCCIGAFLK